MLKKFKIALIFSIFWPLWCFIANAQTGFFQDQDFQFDENFLSGFSEDGRVKVLVLTLASTGKMTETAAQILGKDLELHLYNTNHFTVVGPKEWNAQLKDSYPKLADCHDIACGIFIGKGFRADKVLVGRFAEKLIFNEDAETVPGFTLSVRLVDVVTNQADFVEEIQFTDKNKQAAFFKLAFRIAKNTLLKGRILSVKKRDVTLNLGKAHGLKIGDRLVVYDQGTPAVDLEGQTLGMSQKAVAIIQINRINALTSEAITVQQFERPTSGNHVSTFLSVRKQVRLVGNVRRELDTRKRLNPPIRPLKLKPEILTENSNGGAEGSKWLRRLKIARARQSDTLQSTLISATVTALFISGTFNVSQYNASLNTMLPFIAGGATVYYSTEFISARQLTNELQAEGRVKGYISYNLLPKGVELKYEYKF